MLKKIKWWLICKAYPLYECELCVGQEYWRGCCCQYYNCSGPCQDPSRYQEFLRWVLKKMGHKE